MRWLLVAKRHHTVIVAAAVVLLVAGVWSITAARTAGPQSLDQRVHAVASQIQCPVCHGESVADSPSAIAEQMRALIRQQLIAGSSEQQILKYFRDRYGDSILETPPVQGFNGLMWLGPLAILVAGLLLATIAARAIRRPSLSMQRIGRLHAADAPADDAERSRLRALLRAELADDDGLAAERVDNSGREQM